MLHSLYENAVYTRTDLKPLYATKEALKYTFIVWFSFPLHLFFPSIALAHILGRFLLQFQLPLGNTSSVTFHLVNICLGKRKSKCAKCVQKRWQVFYPIYSNWSCLLQKCAYTWFEIILWKQIMKYKMEPIIFDLYNNIIYVIHFHVIDLPTTAITASL